MIVADLDRMAIMIAVPAAALAGRLTLPEVYVAGALMGVFNLLFDVADHAFLPSVVAPSELLDGNAKLATTDAAAEVTGPAVAGTLVQLITAPFALAVCALTYLASALFLAGIRRSDEAPRAAPQRFDLVAGLRIALSHALVRPPGWAT